MSRTLVAWQTIARHFAGLVERAHEFVDARLVDEGDHRRLPADQEDRVVGGRVELGERLALLDQGRVRRRGDEAEAEDVVGGVAGLVARIGPLVGDECAPVGAEDLDLVAVLAQFPVGVDELRPPEPDRPAGDRRDGGVGGEDRDPLRLGGIEDVDAGSHKGLLQNDDLTHENTLHGCIVFPSTSAS